MLAPANVSTHPRGRPDPPNDRHGQHFFLSLGHGTFGQRREDPRVDIFPIDSASGDRSHGGSGDAPPTFSNDGSRDVFRIIA
jgi:hypothetical protein